MATKLPADRLNLNQKKFCREYILDWNGTRSYMAAYPKVSHAGVASVCAHKLLGNAIIQAYLTDIQKDLEKTAGISRLMILREHQKIAFSSIANLHNTWVDRKEFDALTEEEKSCIAEIQTQTRIEMGGIGGDTPVQVEYVKIKLFDKQKSLDSIAKMLGYNEPDKLILDTEAVKSFTINAASRQRGNSK